MTFSWGYRLPSLGAALHRHMKIVLVLNCCLKQNVCECMRSLWHVQYLTHQKFLSQAADWNGVDKDAEDWGGWGKSCCNFNHCGYWGPALFKLGDSGGASEWKCATCRVEEEFQADLHNAGIDKGRQGRSLRTSSSNSILERKDKPR